MLENLIDISSLAFAYIGAAIILFGGVLAAINVVILAARRSSLDYDDIRRDFTHKIVFGLDFLIASDILKTIIAPTQEEIILLGAIVGIRTILGYFLGMEQ
ncbi:MAG: DUF1622 domain-containing protein [ANME-2 cluster archaeon]|nr:DUF1622 domain-containing protein [ANME-2 cluster archaeon]